MRAQLRSEFFKLRSTPTLAGLAAAMVPLVTLAVLLHGFALSAAHLATRGDQRSVFIEVGVSLGALFASLLGALSITGEIRSGTIRPTLLVTPRRSRVIAAKAVTVLVTGFVTGVIATGVAAGVGSVALAGRGIPVRVSDGDYLTLIAGGGAGVALWAVLGLGVGGAVRSQVPTIVGLLAWLLFVENVLADVPTAHRFAPGALAQALAGQKLAGTLHEPVVAATLLALYATVVLAVGNRAISRRDVA